MILNLYFVVFSFKTINLIILDFINYDYGASRIFIFLFLQPFFNSLTFANIPNRIQFTHFTLSVITDITSRDWFLKLHVHD